MTAEAVKQLAQNDGFRRKLMFPVGQLFLTKAEALLIHKALFHGSLPCSPASPCPGQTMMRFPLLMTSKFHPSWPNGTYLKIGPLSPRPAPK